MLSSMSALSASTRQASRSPLARRSSSSAYSICSGLGENTTLAQGSVHHRAPYLRSPLGECCVHDDHVDGCVEVSESVAEPDGLGEAIRDRLLDDQEVEVAPVVGLAAGMLAKQNHLGWCRRSVYQRTACMLDHRLCGDGVQPRRSSAAVPSSAVCVDVRMARSIVVLPGTVPSV